MKMRITGGVPLMGETTVSGGKNTAVAVIAATVLCDEPCMIENLPDIEDVHVLMKILRGLGAQIEYKANEYLRVDPRTITGIRVPYRLSTHLRASYYFLGALLGRCGQAHVGYPGGCEIGERRFEQHLNGFMALGATVIDQGAMIDVKGTIRGCNFFFDRITVGGTINMMLAAARAEGDTVLYNAAREPHVVDLANFLNSMGAKIRGAGTDTIRIFGVKRLHAASYSVIPDQIETGTLMIMAAATRGTVDIRGCIPTHMEALSAKLLEMGVSVSDTDDVISVRTVGGHRAVNIKTQEYPGFPTDLQQPMSAMLCMARGRSSVTETIFESRFKHLEEMRRMGASVQIIDRVAVIDGQEKLTGAPVTASDLRAGAALVVAGLMAQGDTEIYEPGFIDRGYDHIERKLCQLGARITREPV